jgi:tyrosyl-tRNA synthetase
MNGPTNKKKFIEELRWRGMLHDMTPGVEEQLQKELTAGYIGFDPTADSLHVGNLFQLMILMNFQAAGHKPIVLVGGATGMIGDPSGKSSERNLLDEEILRYNIDCQKKQLIKFLDFESGANAAEMVNNYDWFKEFNALDFLRDVGKHITVNYMMAKDSVQKRLETGISFTEFSYQLIQGYDFCWLYEHKNIRLQMGGSDQWGNIVTGTELIRRKLGGEAFALTSPLVTKADGSKFGKSEGGNIWLDAGKTSPYKFYQFWLNTSDADAAKYIRIFTMLEREAIEAFEADHFAAPHLRILQKELAKSVTVLVHGDEAYFGALETSELLFGKGTKESLLKLSPTDFESAFEGVPQHFIPKADLETGINVAELLAVKTQVFSSKGEARKMIQGGGFSLNKEKVTDTESVINSDKLINNRYILAQKGKKDYHLIIAA